MKKINKVEKTKKTKHPESPSVTERGCQGGRRSERPSPSAAAQQAELPAPGSSSGRQSR